MADTNPLLPSKAPSHLQGLQRTVKQSWLDSHPWQLGGN